jgi:WS/DGAT/MGAT family acyltransferase
VDHELLQAQDATLLCAQDDDAPLQIGALCLFDAAPLRDADGQLRVGDLTNHVAARLDRLSRFRRRLEPVPFDLVPPVWVDDDRFAIEHHVQRAALPEPGDDQQLRECVARLVERPLDPSRPLWQLWLVEGVAGDRVAVVLLCSHVMADGMALLDFALSMLDPSPVAAPAAPTSPAPSIDPPPAPISLLTASLVERTRRRLALVGRSLSALRDPLGVLATTAELVRSGASRASGAWGPAGVLAPELPITRPVGPHRDVAWRSVSMPEVIGAAHTLGVPLNDVVLAIVAGALRRYLADHDVAVDSVRPRTIVPVSIHGAAPGQEIENRFSLMVTELPVHLSDPVGRVRFVHREMQRHKASAVRPLVPHLFEISDVVPVSLLHAAAPALLRRQPLVNLAVTNLPGTPDPMYLLGSPMSEVYPFVSLTGNIAVIIGVLSYRDRLGVGITVDADVVPDVDALADAVAAAAAELLDRVQDDPPRPRRRPGPLGEP